MHETCPVCALKLEREPGYFIGAMYFGYGLGLLVLIPLFFVLQAMFPDWPRLLAPTVALLIYLPIAPLMFRYSRTLWIYFDRSVWSSADDPD